MSSTSKLGQLLRAAISFVVVIGAYCAYAALAVPLIEPAAAEREGPDAPFEPAPPPTSRHAQLLQRLYPDPQSWQRQRPKIIETDQAILLLKDYDTLVDGRMELKPCSLLFLPDESKPTDGHEPRVVVLDAPQGAILQFDQPLDLRKAEFGRLIGGRLVGEVTFRSHGGENPEEQLFLTTRNVNMDERRIWTPHEVHFRYGKNYGDGRDLIVTLLPATEATGKQRGPNVGGIKSLELVRLERLHLVGRASIFPSKDTLARRASEDSTLARRVSEGGADADPSLTRRASVASPASNDTQETPIEVTCQGPFLFDLEESIATFEDQVNVLRLNPDGPSDQLNCRLLEIHFTQSLLNRTDEDKGAKPQAAAAAVKKVVALGHPVVLQSPSMGAQARGDRLEYDLIEKKFLLKGDQPVMLQHEGRRIEARAVQYQLPETGRIGTAWAKGPGQFRAEVGQVSRPVQSDNRQQEQESPPRILTAVWQGELNLRPDGPQHVLSLTGGARVGEDAFGGLSAGEIHLWLSEQSPSPPSGSRSRGNLDARTLTSSATAMPSILPDRLLAETNVQLSSPALSGDTERFEVWFHHIPQQAITDDNRSRETSGGASGLASRTLTSSATGSRYHVSGKLLRVLLAVAGKNMQLRDVSVEGNAQITESQVANGQDIPLRIAGEMVHVTAADSDQSKAVIVGKPAVVSGRGVAIEGASVHLDRAANRAWVPGPGQATLPMSGADALGRGNARTDEGVRPAKAESAIVTWRDGMQFDGRTVQLRGDVLARTQTKRLAAPALDVSLTKRIDFSQPPRRDRIEVQSVQFHGQVTAESRTLEEGKLVSVDQMLVRQLHIDNQSGELTADGPGWLKTVRHGPPARSVSEDEHNPAA